jgi:flagellar assembly protein FliH
MSKTIINPPRKPQVLKAGTTAAVQPLEMTRFEQRSVTAQSTVAPTPQQQHQQGYDAGYQEGLAQARADVIAATEDSNRRVRRALAALTEAVDMFDNRQTVALADVEDAIVAGAFALAHSILQRELITATDPGADALARALQLVPDRGDVVARLHPDDVATLNMERVTSTGRTVHLVPDASIELGGCVAEVGDMRIDAQLTSALQHAARAMSVDPELVDIEAPVVDEDVEGARMQAAMEALQRAAIGAENTPQGLDADAVIEGTEAASTSGEARNATNTNRTTAGRSRKSSRKNASEAP